jgi:CheY-like chemotaxis protein
MTTLCIAEDNEMDRFILKLMLAKFDSFTSVLFFNDGMSLLDHLKCNRQDSAKLPDIILLDLYMPVLDGWGFLKEFNSMNYTFSKSIQIYVLTVSINPADAKRTSAYGFVKDFISKPVTKEKLSVISNLVLV